MLSNYIHFIYRNIFIFKNLNGDCVNLLTQQLLIQLFLQKENDFRSNLSQKEVVSHAIGESALLVFSIINNSNRMIVFFDKYYY